MVELAHLPIHVPVEQDGQAQTAKQHIVHKAAIMEEFALDQTYVDVKQDGQDTTAQYLTVLKDVIMADVCLLIHAIVLWDGLVQTVPKTLMNVMTQKRVDIIRGALTQLDHISVNVSLATSLIQQHI